MFKLAQRIPLSVNYWHKDLGLGIKLIHQARATSMNSSVAVVLSGSGVYDGSEVHEASAILVHLSRCGVTSQVYAPDINQFHVIDHTAGQPMQENRNVLKESARIARGKIEPLSKLKSTDHAALVFPGGFGAAKNLSNFATDGDKCKVNGEVEKVIKDFHSAKKPIGLCCIAPVLAAKVLGSSHSVEVTVGQDKDSGDNKWPYAGTAQAITSMGAKHANRNVNEVCVDEQNQVVTTPAFMCETAYHEIYDGIGNMIQAVVKMINK